MAFPTKLTGSTLPVSSGCEALGLQVTFAGHGPVAVRAASLRLVSAVFLRYQVAQSLFLTSRMWASNVPGQHPVLKEFGLAEALTNVLDIGSGKTFAGLCQFHAW